MRIYFSNITETNKRESCLVPQQMITVGLITLTPYKNNMETTPGIRHVIISHVTAVNPSPVTYLNLPTSLV